MILTSTFLFSQYLSKDSPLMNIFDELEYLVEWALDSEMLIVTALSVCFTYLETVCVVTILFMITDKNVFGFSHFFCSFDVFNYCAHYEIDSSFLWLCKKWCKRRTVTTNLEFYEIRQCLYIKISFQTIKPYFLIIIAICLFAICSRLGINC